MKTADNMDFPVQEYENRIQKLREKMQQQDVDAVLLTTAENTRYFCGLQSIVWNSKVSTPGLLVVTQKGELALIGSATAVGPMQATSCLEDRDLYWYSREGSPGIAENYQEAIYDVLKKFGVHRGRLGMELGRGFRIHMTYPVYSALMQLLSDCEITDIADILWSIRSVKTPREIEVIRRACAVNDLCYRAAFDSIEPGKSTEWSIFQAAADKAFELGCESMPTMGILFGEGRYTLTNCPPSDKIISNAPHQVLFLDGGPCYDGYYTDIIRTAVTGSLTEKQKRMDDVSRIALQAAFDAIEPGVPCAEISRRVNEAVTKEGLHQYHQTFNWTGHSLGLDIHELPELSVRSGSVLEEGMFLSVEPLIMDRECGMFATEQNILVTSGGFELLSRYPAEMAIL